MPELTVMLWIESGAGTIVRGHVDSIGAAGVRVRLAQQPDFVQGDEVAVRICFERGAPTVAVRARVDWLREDGDAVECELVWTAAAEERADLDAWLEHAA
jgi:hypothetical protein